MVKPIPDDYPRVSASLSIDGAAAAIEFYQEVFGAEVRMRLDDPDGRVGHAELVIGDSVLMVADEYPEAGFVSPTTIGGTPVSFNVFVEDADATFARALALGGAELRPVEDQFYGDRSGQFEDPWGHRWGVSSRVEDVTPDELERRANRTMGGAPG